MDARPLPSVYHPAKPQSFQYEGSGYTLRSTYPTFIPFLESLQLQLKWAWHGLYDAFRWNVVFTMVTSDSEIRANIYKSLLLNSLSLSSIYTFELVIEPLVHDQEIWLHRHIGWFYQVLWLLPVVGMAFYLNSSWCNTIAKRTYVLQHGSRAAAQQQSATYTGVLKAIATSAYRLVMVFTSLLVTFGLGIIPYFGSTGAFVFLCWIDAYYCFEFVWISRGFSLSRRVRHLEERWAYYLAFGFPSTAICMIGSGLASAALFALVYPAYIILAMHAQPMPKDPYSPLPPSDSQDHEVMLHPSPFIPIRVPVFALVIWLNDLIVRVLSVGGGGSAKRKRTGRNRAFSDHTESVEEGGGISIDVKATRSKRVRTAGERVTIERRKLD